MTVANTSQMVFLPSKPNPALISFTSPILSLLDTYVRAPFFGANFWVATVKPVPGGGIPPDHPAVELKLTFREGGAFDFHSCFEQIKERLYYAQQMAREQGRTMGLGEDVNTDQLPAYEPPTETHEDDGRPPAFVSSPTQDEVSRAQVPEEQGHGAATGGQEDFAPQEPPPGYEEVQARAVEVTFEEERRHRVEMGRESDAETESDIVSRREVPSRSPESRRDGQPPLRLGGPEGDMLQQNPW